MNVALVIQLWKGFYQDCIKLVMEVVETNSCHEKTYYLCRMFSLND